MKITSFPLPFLAAPFSGARLRSPPAWPRRALAVPPLQPASQNSVFTGVRVGTITYSYRSMFSNAEQILEALVTDGLSEWS
jgi:hypothetical protein